MKISFRHIFAALPLIALGALATSAQAIVLQWNYSLTSAFAVATYNGVPGTPSPPDQNALFWGPGAAQSSLVIGNNPALGAIDTFIGGGSPPPTPQFVGPGISLTHNNVVIALGTSLDNAILRNSIILDPLVPNNAPLPAQIANFNIKFVETPNFADTCPVAGSPIPCNDIFVLTGGLLNFSFFYDDGTGNSQYFVNIFPITGGVLGVLPNATCAAAGQGPNCLGFTTPESQSTTLQFGFTISTQPLTVPEPGSLALFGIALAGLGISVANRKRRRS